MKRIPLSRTTTFALVDDADYDDLSQFTWHLIRGYASRTYRKDGKQKWELMHRRLIPNPPGELDHIDGNRLNNQRLNLRVATRTQNLANAGKNTRKDATSRFKGVSKKTDHFRSKPWKASINHRCIGLFATEEEAALAYDAAACELYGEFARPNFPENNLVTPPNNVT